MATRDAGPGDRSRAAPAGSTLFDAARVAAFIETAGATVGLRDDHLGLFVSGLLEADLRGIDSHGVYRLPFYCRGFANGDVNVAPEPKRIRGRGATEVIDADNGLGVIVGQLGMLRAVEMAKAFGVGIVAIRDSNHAGMLASHVLQASNAGMIGYFLSNAPALMAPWGGREAMLSNSPFAWAIPSDDEPVVLDMACSNVARGRVRLAAQKDERIPLDWAIDAAGMPTDDPHEAMKGLVMPMAGYKGYGIAFVNEILSAVLPQATLSVDVSRAFLREGVTGLDAWGIGHLAVALDISAFQDPEIFTSSVTSLVERMRGSGLARGHDRIMVPGEPEAIKRRARVADGIPISNAVLRDLDTFATEFGIRPLSQGVAHA